MSRDVDDFVRQVEVAQYLFEDDGAIPNNPKLPLLIYPGVLKLDAGDSASIGEILFNTNDWGSSWRNGIYPFPHYHSTAHEALVICRGEARVRLGGEKGQMFTVRAGDVAVLPAGMGHENLGASADLLVVGAYPPGQNPDLCRGRAGERPRVLENIEQVPLPAADPVYGPRGLLMKAWTG